MEIQRIFVTDKSGKADVQPNAEQAKGTSTSEKGTPVAVLETEQSPGEDPKGHANYHTRKGGAKDFGHPEVPQK